MNDLWAHVLNEQLRRVAVSQIVERHADDAHLPHEVDYVRAVRRTVDRRPLVCPN